MRNQTRLIISAMLLTALITDGGCNAAKNGAKADATPAAPSDLLIKAKPAVRTEWTVTVPISGNLRSQSMVDVKVEVGGKLMAIYFQEGDLVRNGQLLAEIDTANYRLAYEQAVATVGVAEAGLARTQVTADHARRENERADNLLRTGGITEKDHEAASTIVKESETQVRLGEAQVKQARAALSIAEKALKDCKITSPARGHVQKKFFDQGSLMVPGSPLYTLVDNSRLELDCLLPSYRLSGIRIGQRAVFTTPTWGDRRFQGIVSALNPVVEADNRSIRITVRIANPGGELRTGMYARGDIEVHRQADAMVIPRSALMVEKDESAAGSVYIVKDGKTARRTVQVGGIQQDRVWIREGLQAGELIVVEIGPALKDGTSVRVATGTGAQGE